ncbi:4268_t:CDS:2 [Funneliformis caledonium]|uniref:4268_t:CDS:1 n=1 Tax=Funneliformis caledonium TaxID=1117310 RepID=A0A9N9CQD0_9GLOM|nr:4268_t:CDS:2 [Funneliformis caledonium]
MHLIHGRNYNISYVLGTSNNSANQITKLIILISMETIWKQIWPTTTKSMN